MASSAGFQLAAGRIPGERIATSTNTSDSSTFTTTETSIGSVTAALVSGRTYRVRWHGGLVTTVADTPCIVRLREDSISGTIFQERVFSIIHAGSSGEGAVIEGEFTASSTANKTFVAGGIRFSGTGTLHADGAATHPRQIYVDYISG